MRYENVIYLESSNISGKNHHSWVYIRGFLKALILARKRFLGWVILATNDIQYIEFGLSYRVKRFINID